ncbi:hypothetical protein [Bacillus cereus]|uniref:hypothetical protein n=1 Tax=Bacillus cereus TaxID=1396 RepID=UPI000BF4E310|nr:hypothetical protein [Bacillus cereus]PFO83581.1 hypothetical protein COJ77_08300 [Bacillus cereus]
MSSAKGRPQKYNDEMLKKILEDFLTNYQGPIKYLMLEKQTGIPRHVWSRRMKETIQSINASYIQLTDTNNVRELPIPNVNYIIERYKHHPDILSEKLCHLTEVFHSLQEQINKDKEELKKMNELKQTIKNHENTIRNLQKVVQQYESIIFDSSNPSFRKENNLNSNLISINNTNKEQSSSLSLKEALPIFFDD